MSIPPAVQVRSAALDVLVDRHVWALGPFVALTNLRLRDCQLGAGAGPACSCATAICLIRQLRQLTIF